MKESGVVMLVNEFPPLPVGGAERQAARLGAYLARRGWPVWVITRRRAGLPARERRQGMEIVRPPTFGPGKLQTLTFVLGAMVALWRLRARYRLLHAHLAFGPAFAAALTARLLGKRVLVKLGNSGPFGDIQTSQRTLRGRVRLAALRRWADRILVLDETMHAEALQAGFDPQRIRRVENGIDAAYFTPADSREQARARLALPPGETVILFVGRLTEQKSLPTLLHALAQALPSRPNLRLILLGEGPLRPSLEALARRLGIHGRVLFPGAHEDVRPYLHAADIFAIPSLSEGISNALLEAMAAGLACVASEVGGNPHLLDGGRCGLLLPPGEVEAWKNALLRLSDDAALRTRLGRRARQRVLERFDFRVVGARVESLYEEMLREEASGR